ncbi:cis-zeatin O-glucosyltransferase 1-like [Sorghum bicolor]|uniref:cis-zeatin O-glucosyltransferase 1-like n=1 Tax=Sorghum bicolor TaxID=4558 RepID=UPI000B42512D|nr:cis-zeatin O-glucosyltransferase 1-like [Sorghum bicolor]|eukprot:XP_021315289.1 cis-zeatin O-glucosyltransferase 1-like [Sorghum bicolor]
MLLPATEGGYSLLASFVVHSSRSRLKLLGSDYCMYDENQTARRQESSFRRCPIPAVLAPVTAVVASHPRRCRAPGRPGLHPPRTPICRRRPRRWGRAPTSPPPSTPPSAADAQRAGSVLYVSLGSFLSVSAAQFDEIAAGLAETKARFLWVLRDADACSRARGLIRDPDAGRIVPWTDQLRVLCHRSVLYVFTHYGMNSALEAVYSLASGTWPGPTSSSVERRSPRPWRG